MKHLKTYNKIFESDITEMPLLPDLVVLPENVKSELKDICLELQDDGFNILLREYEYKSKGTITSKYDYLIIDKLKYAQSGKSLRNFIKKDVMEVIERIKDYLSSVGYNIYVDYYKLHDSFARNSQKTRSEDVMNQVTIYFVKL